MKKTKGFFSEFKEFLSRGNVMDLAIGLIIGSAFTAIVASLNNDIISPILGLFGGVDFSNLMVKIGGNAHSPVIKYGTRLPTRSPARGAAPTIASIVPNKGPLAGGNTITITGSNLRAQPVWQQIGSAYDGSCIISAEGKAYCWGWNGFGQLSNGSTTQ